MSDRRSDFSFARRPVWLLGHLVAVVAIVMFFMFGSWQLSRLEERRAENATIEQRSFGAPMGLDEALAVWDEDPSDLDYQRIAVGVPTDTRTSSSSGRRPSMVHPAFESLHRLM